MGAGFSSLSESGFIPTGTAEFKELFSNNTVLISFREWLHSYAARNPEGTAEFKEFSSLSESGFIPTSRRNRQFQGTFFKVLISFREWLHSYIHVRSQRGRS